MLLCKYLTEATVRRESLWPTAQSSMLAKVWQSGSVHIPWPEVEERHARARWFSPLPFLFHLPHPQLWAHATYSCSGLPLSVNPRWRWLQRCDQSLVKVTMKVNHCQQPQAVTRNFHKLLVPPLLGISKSDLVSGCPWTSIYMLIHLNSINKWTGM